MGHPLLMEYMLGNVALNVMDNRTAAILHLHTHYIIIALSAAAVLVGYLMVMPGIRKHKCNTCVAIVTLVLACGTNFLSLTAPCWVSGTTVTRPPVKYGSTHHTSNDNTACKVGAFLGLTSVNLTLWSLESGNNRESAGITLPNTTLEQPSSYLYLNHELLLGTNSFRDAQFRSALVHGLPDELLCLAETLMISRVGLNVGGAFTDAGYLASVPIYASLFFTGLSFIFFLLLPYHAGTLLVVVGLCDGLALLVYFLVAPKLPLKLMVNGSTLVLHYDWMMYLVGGTACWCIVVGLLIKVLLLMWPGGFETSIEVTANECRRYGRTKYVVTVEGKKLLFNTVPLGCSKLVDTRHRASQTDDDDGKKPQEEERDNKWTYNRRRKRRLDGVDNQVFVDDDGAVGKSGVEEQELLHRTQVYIDPSHDGPRRTMLRSVSVEMLSSPEKEDFSPSKRRSSVSFIPVHQYTF